MTKLNGSGESLSARMRKNLAAQQKLCDEWNAKVKIGDPVDFFERDGGPAQRFTAQTKAEVMSNHTAVVWLNGKSGCVAVKACAPVALLPVGVLGGLCNRGACRAPGANWFNHSTMAHYCEACAGMINKANHVDAQKWYGHELCTLAAKPELVGIDSDGGAHD